MRIMVLGEAKANHDNAGETREILDVKFHCDPRLRLRGRTSNLTSQETVERKPER
jgi:hypothetical protein